MPLVPFITQQGITAKLAEQGIVAKVDETLDEIIPPIPPVIAITLDSIDTAEDPGEVTIGFVYSDADGTVAKIELFQRFNLGAAASIQVFEPPDPSPFQHQVTALAEGDYCWFAVATDDTGLQTQSNMIQATIDPPPPADPKLEFTVPKVYSNAEPLLENNDWAAFLLSPGRVDQVSGKGEIAKVSQYAFIQKEEDLKLRGKYIVRWKWAPSGPNVNIFLNVWIAGSKLTSGVSSGGSFYGNGASRQPIIETRPFFGSGEAGHIDILHSFTNPSGTLANAKVSISGSAWPQGLEVVEEIEYDGVSFFWRTDLLGVTGFSSGQRNTQKIIAGNILDRPSHHLLIGIPLTNIGNSSLIKADDVEVITQP